jgi:hypothetical protein
VGKHSCGQKSSQSLPVKQRDIPENSVAQRNASHRRDTDQQNQADNDNPKKRRSHVAVLAK